MNAARVLERVATAAIRRPWVTIALIASLSVLGLAAATGLRTDAGTETLVDKDSPEFKSTQDFREKFGDDAIVVLAREDLQKLLLTADLEPLFELETCLAGGTDLAATLPKQSTPLPEVCDQIADLAPARVVYGPATFLFQATSQIGQVLEGQSGAAQQRAQEAAQIAARQAASQGRSDAEQQAAAQAASEQVLQGFQGSLIQLALKYQIPLRPPQLDDPQFVSRVVFESGPGTTPGTPKERFNYLFPTPGSALISARLRPDLNDEERKRAVGLFQQAIADPRFKLTEGGYVVSGVPAVVEGLSGAIRSQLFLLLGAAALVMSITLFLILPPPLRLLPLAVSLAASGLLFGLISLAGGALTVAAVAMLPVLVGLSVDYAIQLQARFNEARDSGLAPARAAVAAAGAGGPVVGLACLATMAGFAALALSPSPLVRSFGLLLVVGVALAFALTLTGGFAALVLAGWNAEGRGTRRAPARARGKLAARIGELGKQGLAVAIASPGRVLVAAAILATCGWVASVGTDVETDVRDLAPAGLAELRDLDVLEAETGISGEVNVVVHSQDFTDPDVIEWMRTYQQRVLSRHGYSGADPSCEDAEICPAISLTDLFSDSGADLSPQRIQTLIATIPTYFSQAVITRDPATGGIGDTANIAFGIRTQSLADQQALIDDIRAQVAPKGVAAPPTGTTVDIAGLAALAAEANDDLSNSRWWLPFAGLLFVAIALLVTMRSVTRALVPLLPVLLATGWSGLIIAALGVPLNPMSATLGALVIAVATEFSVILAARYRSERAGGLSPGEALRTTYERTGTAVVASGVTVTAGFGVLAVAGIPFLADLGLPAVAPILRDFGLVTVADMAASLIGVMLVLPAALIWAEDGFPLPQLRRPATVAAPAAATAPIVMYTDLSTER